MKKIKAFTLLEMIIVITIIAFVSLSLSNMIKNAWQGVDIWREATNIIFKEMNQYVKDFERNKIRDDGTGTHDISFLRIIIWETGNQMIVWNYYSWDGLEYFDSWALITQEKYTAFQYLKWANGFKFRVRNKSWSETSDITSIWISDIWKIYTWDAYPTESETGWLTWSLYEFVICWWNSVTLIPIWAITINAATKTARLDRCESDRYAWINCDTRFKNCNSN